MDKRRLFEKIKNNPKNVRFNDLCNAAEAFGFRFKGGKGSHRIFVKDNVPEFLNFQNVGGRAKPYQVKQFIRIVEKYNLTTEE